MLFIIEIILTIFAWRNGWRYYSLIPVGAAFFVGLMVGFSGGVSLSPLIFVDILAVIALIYMVSKKGNYGKKIDKLE